MRFRYTYQRLLLPRYRKDRQWHSKVTCTGINWHDSETGKDENTIFKSGKLLRQVFTLIYLKWGCNRQDRTVPFTTNKWIVNTEQLWPLPVDTHTSRLPTIHCLLSKGVSYVCARKKPTADVKQEPSGNDKSLNEGHRRTYTTECHWTVKWIRLSSAKRVTTWRTWSETYVTNPLTVIVKETEN